MRSFAWVVFGFCALLAGAGCAALHLEEPRFDGDAGAPSGPPDAGAKADAGLPLGDALPNVKISSPQSGASLPAGVLRIEGEASDDRGLSSVFVKVGPNVPLLAQTSDNFQHWWLESKLPQGMFFVEAEARDTADQLGDADRIALLGPTTGSDDAAPSVVIDSPPDKSAPLHALVLVRGTAADDRAVVSMDVLRNGDLLKERPVETDDFFGSWSRLVPLIPGIDNLLTFVARDAGGREGRAEISLFGRAEIDREAPELAITSPADQATVNTATLLVTGTAADEVGLREVKLRIGQTPSGSQTIVYGDYATVDTSDGYVTWQKALPIPVGVMTLEARAIDLNGLGTSVTVSLNNELVPEWTEEVAIPLRLREDEAAPTLSLSLDKEGLNEVIAENIQRDTVVLELETSALMTNALNQIKDSCGTKWRLNNANPQHDCTLTPLGQSYGANWRASPEYSFVRLLTMTPRNAVVDGTSISDLKGVANALNVGGGFNEVLSDTLGIPLTQEIVSTGGAVRALQEFWMKNHPEVLPGAKLPITLYDAMQNLAPLKDRFGPKAGHPGLLDPSFTPDATLFGPDFEFVLEAASNLRWMDGVDVSGGAAPATRATKDYMALVIDTAGPTYDDVLEFDFTNPSKFDVVGLIDHPKVDLRMSVIENNQFVRSCVQENNTCKNNLPSAPAGGYVWANPAYEVETIFAGAAYFDYSGRSNYSKTYSVLLIPSATVTVGKSEPAGWATFWTLFSIGSPPPDQYLWELILEVAQVALHNFGGTTLSEGSADVAFTLRDIDVGLSAAQIRNAMRPKLQEQRHTLSDKLLGDYKANNGEIDFFYRRAADNLPYVYFVAESDPRPVAGYGYDKPGFFSDEALSTKVSSKDAGTSGDSAHEKLRLSTGETTLYMRDEQAETYRLRFVAGNDDKEIRVFVSRKVH